MKNTVVKIFFIFLILFFYTSFSQIKPTNNNDSTNFEVKINPDFFLLGTFSDYCGRFQYVSRYTQIDRYYPYEEPIMKYIVNFIKMNYKISVDTTFEKNRGSSSFFVGGIKSQSKISCSPRCHCTELCLFDFYKKNGTWKTVCLVDKRPFRCCGNEKSSHAICWFS